MADYSKQQMEQLRDRWKGHEEELRALIPVIKADPMWHESKEYKALMEALGPLPPAVEVAERDLRGIYLKEVDLSGAKLSRTDLSGADLENVGMRNADLLEADLRKAILNTTDLRGCDLRGIQVDGDTDWGIAFARYEHHRMPVRRFLGYKGKIYSEQLSRSKEDFKDTQRVYSQLWSAYRNVESGTSNYFAYRESHCKRVSQYKWYNPFRWVGAAWEYLTCSGTAPVRFLVWIGVFILIFAGIYRCFPTGIVRYVGNKPYPLSNCLEALYFSVVTFTTLGFGDFRPHLDSCAGPFLAIVCSLEAFFGVLSTALLVVIFYRFMTKQ